MAEVKWIKIVTNIFDDEKIQLIEGIPEGDAILVIWFKIICLAGKSNHGGFLMLKEEIPYTQEMLVSIFRRKETTVKLALETFVRFGMIEIVDNVLYLSNFERYQNIEGLAKIREQARLRKQKQREKIKAEEQREKIKAEEQECHVTVTDASRSSSISISNSNISNSNINKQDNIISNIKDINSNSKEKFVCFGEYKWIKLRFSQYEKLKRDFPGLDIDLQIRFLDEYVQSNANKNKYKDWNLVLRKSIRDKWFTRPVLSNAKKSSDMSVEERVQRAEDYMRDFGKEKPNDLAYIESLFGVKEK